MDGSLGLCLDHDAGRWRPPGRPSADSIHGARAAIAGIEAANRAYEALVQALRISIVKLKKQRFGASSEKIERELEQLELALESLETARAAALATPEADILGRIRAHDPEHLDELFPWTRRAIREATPAAA